MIAKINRSTSAFILFFLLSCNAYSDVSDKTQNEIDYLLSHIEQSDCLFNRNGIDYKGSKVISHIKTKYKYFKEEIKTTEDFITLSATKSEMSGKKYTVRCNKNDTEELGRWLFDVLTRSRSLSFPR